jgi:hypothetical protein
VSSALFYKVLCVADDFLQAVFRIIQVIYFGLQSSQGNFESTANESARKDIGLFAVQSTGKKPSADVFFKGMAWTDLLTVPSSVPLNLSYAGSQNHLSKEHQITDGGGFEKKDIRLLHQY